MEILSALKLKLAPSYRSSNGRWYLNHLPQVRILDTELEFMGDTLKMKTLAMR